MKIIFCILLLSSMALNAATDLQAEVDEIVKMLDGSFKERKTAKEKLANLTGEYYPYFETHLKNTNLSTEVKLSLNEESLYTLKARWLKIVRIKWYNKNIIDAYNQFGDRNEKWNANAIKAFNYIIDWLAQDKSPKNDNSGEISRLCNVALNSGCKDPLLILFAAQGEESSLSNIRNSLLKTRYQRGYKDMMKSQYHDFFKIQLLTSLAFLIDLKWDNESTVREPMNALKGVKYMDEVIALYGKATDDQEIPLQDLFKMNENIFTTNAVLKQSYDATQKLISEIVEKKATENKQLKLIIQTVYLYKVSLRDNLSEDSQKSIEEDFFNTLEKLWEINKGHSGIASIAIEKSSNKKDLEKFDFWFKRMMLIDPVNLNALDKKIILLRDLKLIDNLWSILAEFTASQHLFLKRTPEIIRAVGNVKFSENNDQLYFPTPHYLNKEIWAKATKAYEIYTQKFPADKDYIFEHAELASYMGFWNESYELFKKAGNIKSYKGQLNAKLLEETRNEAELYYNKKITPKPHYLNYTEAHVDNYNGNKKRFINYYQAYQKNNPENPIWENDVKNGLTLLFELFCGNPDSRFNTLDYQYKAYQLLAKAKEAGNKDPLVNSLATIYSSIFKKDVGNEKLAICQTLLSSQYPNEIKFYQALFILSDSLDEIKDPKNKEIINKIISDIIQCIDKNTESLDNYKLLQILILRAPVNDITAARKELLTKVKEKNSLATHYTLSALDLFIENGLSKKKPTEKEYIKNVDEGQKLLKMAWMEDPLNSFVNYIRLDTLHVVQPHTEIYFRRFLDTNLFPAKGMEDFVRMRSFGHNICGKWSEYPDSLSGIQLVFLLHAEEHSKGSAKGNEAQYLHGLKNHYYLVKKSLVKHLAIYPKDVITRTQLVCFAIRCQDMQTADEHLKILGDCILLSYFDGNVEEFKKKYSKPNN